MTYCVNRNRHWGEMSSIPCSHALCNVVLYLLSSRARVYFSTYLNLADLVTCFSHETVANVMQVEASKVFVLCSIWNPEATLCLSLCISLLEDES